ncbi:hypothetical protein B0H13DRAFT_1896364 [Mycena leptocephala]|nr:hypothetical protein B0H13DRAFT_1896364 [Mycena leptocephala]
MYTGHVKTPLVINLRLTPRGLIGNYLSICLSESERLLQFICINLNFRSVRWLMPPPRKFISFTDHTLACLAPELSVGRSPVKHSQIRFDRGMIDFERTGGTLNECAGREQKGGTFHSGNVQGLAELLAPTILDHAETHVPHSASFPLPTTTPHSKTPANASEGP